MNIDIQKGDLFRGEEGAVMVEYITRDGTVEYKHNGRKRRIGLGAFLENYERLEL